MTSQQGAVPGVITVDAAAQPYILASDAMARLTSEFGLTCTLANGHVLAASMAVDEEGPFFGVKVDPTQDRSWPRTFRYGYPNITVSPSSILSTSQMPGAFYLDYEGVVPYQVADWVCLEAYRMVSMPLLQGISQESVGGGVSVKYDYTPGLAMLDRLQESLLSPFQMRMGHTQAFPAGLIH